MVKIESNEVPDYENELTPEEEQELLNYMSSGSYPRMQEQNSIVGFFNRVLKTKDTTKAGNLRDGELMAVRTFQSTAEYCKNMGLFDVEAFIRQLAEITLATSLSRDGRLLNAVVTSKKQLSTESMQTGEKKGKWLNKKE